MNKTKWEKRLRMEELSQAAVLGKRNTSVPPPAPLSVFPAPHTEWEHPGGCGNICTGVFTARQSIFGLMHAFHQHFLLHWGKSLLDNTLLYPIQRRVGALVK